ncbi:MAG: Hpt domain-containing protein [Spirochaetales bacterium]|nr:Hpt domain-containing protein [Spirochaetales bacterium]
MNHHLAKPIDKEELGAIIALYFDVVPSGKIPGQGNERPEDESERDGIDMAQLDSVIEDETVRESLLDTFSGTWMDFTEEALLFDVMGKSFSRRIHSLKGASGNLSAYAVHNLCDRLERTESRVQKEVLRTRLIQELEKVIAKISSQKKTIQKGEEIVTREELAMVIDQWIERLNAFEAMDTTEINTFINQLGPFTAPSISERHRRAIEGFETVRSCELLIEKRKDLL